MKKRSFLAAVLAALFLFSGCSISEMDKLYSLPQPSQEYLQLQKLIDAEISNGSEYSAPTAGSLRQSVQLTDLDGDGTDEALAFLRNKEQQPEVCIYRKISGNYALAATIMGEGTAIGRVEYSDLNDDGFAEIIISWEVNSEMRILKAYSIQGWIPSVLMTESCIDFQISDLNSDGRPEILALSLEQSGGKVDMYSLDRHNELVDKTAKLSSSLKTADRFRIADIDSGVPAVFVEGQYNTENSSCLLTDIIVVTGGELKNITLDSATGDSTTKRNYAVYCADVDGNGTLDVPFAQRLSLSRSVTPDYIFNWYSYDPSGKKELCASTYHCYADGWYFTLPDGWKDGLIIKRDNDLAGEHALTFAQRDVSGKINNLLTVYTLTDENRNDRAKMNGRFTLLSSETVIYAAKIGTENDTATETEKQDIISRFHLIYTEWNSGDL